MTGEVVATVSLHLLHFIGRICTLCIAFASLSTECIMFLTHANGHGVVFEQGLCIQWLVVPRIRAWLLREVEMMSPLFGGLAMQSLTSSFKVIESGCWLARIHRFNNPF